MLSPIQTRRHWIRKIVFEPRETTLKKSKYDTQISLRHYKCEDSWHVQLNVSFGGDESEEANYRGQIEFEGVFVIHPGFPQDKVEELVKMNGGAILYGAVRELVLTLTARSKHGPFEMPTIDARMFLKPPMKKTRSKPKKLASKKPKE